MKKKNPDNGVFVDLTYDAGFKTVFADKANKELLRHLLNNVLPKEAHINNILEYLDREQPRDTVDSHRSHLDLLCESDDGRRFIVECQKANETAFFQRCVYYASGVYHTRLKAGEKYSVLRPVYSIAFLNYRIKHNDDFLWNADNILSEWIFTEKRTGEVAPSTISIIFAELNRFTKTEAQCKSELDWLFYIFRHSVSLTEIPAELKGRQFFKDLLEACRIAAFDEKKKIQYESSMMDERDIIAQREYALEEGIRETNERNARNLLKAGIDPKTIAECLEMPIEDVMALQNSCS